MFGMASLIAMSMLFIRTGRDLSAANPEIVNRRTHDLLRGLRHVRTDTVLFVTIIVTIVMNVFAFPYHLMIPVIGTDKLHVDPVLVGLLFSIEGVGATLGALVVAAMAQPRHFTRVFTYSSVGLLAILMAFAFAPWYWLVLPLLFIAGFAMSGFATMQSSNRRHFNQSSDARESAWRSHGGNRLRTHRRALGRIPRHKHRRRPSSTRRSRRSDWLLTAATVLSKRRYLRSIPRPRR